MLAEELSPQNPCTVEAGPVDPCRHPVSEAVPCVPQALVSLKQDDSTANFINPPSSCDLEAKKIYESAGAATAIDTCTGDLVCRSGPSSRQTTPGWFQAPTVLGVANDRSDYRVAEKVSKPPRAVVIDDGYKWESGYIGSDSPPSDRKESPSASDHGNICTSVVGVKYNPRFRGP